MSPRRHWLPLLSALALLLTPFALAPQLARAQSIDNIIVDKSSDDSATGTYCTAALNDCSLRQAITYANSRPANNVKNITFSTAVASPIVINNVSGNLPAITGGNTAITGRVQLGVSITEITGSGSNRGVGIELRSNGNTISSLIIRGFDDAASSRGGSGVYIAGSGNRVINSFIGVRPDGTVGANFRGIRIASGSSGNLIGYDQASGGVANVIAGNTGIGIEIVDSSNNTVKGNYIGLRPTGASATILGNGSYGIQISSDTGNSSSNQIGGVTELEANIIGGNNNAGVQITGANTNGTLIRSNFIGAYVAGLDLGNLGDGVRIDSGASDNILSGGDVPLLISDNSGYGVLIRGSATSGNTITGNTSIGLNLNQDGPLANGEDGVRITDNSSGNVITGGAVLIGGNAKLGVRIDSSSASGNRIESAFIGAVPSPITQGQTITIANAQGGVLVSAAKATTVSGNTISGNTGFGLRLSGTEGVTVTGNFVGLDAARKATAPNTGPGIQLWNAPNTLVGGSATATNYIAGNAGAGVVISGTTTISVVLRSNLLGLVQQAATTNYLARGPNLGEGILVTGGAHNITLDANTVAGSADTLSPDYAGISVAGAEAEPSLSDTRAITITGNRIGWMPTAAGGSTLVPFPNGDGVAVSGGVEGVSILTNTIRLNEGVGVRLTDTLTSTVRGNNSISRNRAGGVAVGGASANLTIQGNLILDSGRNNAGAVVNAGADAILISAGPGGIRGAQVLSNTIRANTGRGIALVGDVDHATMRFNALALNGGAIALEGSTIYDGSGPDPDQGNTSIPNHGIDPPIVDLDFASPLSLRINQAGFFEGYVYTSTVKSEAGLLPASACVTCTIQIFRPDRTAPSDTQGWELVRSTVEAGTGGLRDSVPVAANGRFSGRILDGLPGRLIFIATDGFGNSSAYAALPLTGGLTLEPVSSLARDAAPGDVVTYTLRLRNTGTVGYSDLALSTSGTLARWAVATAPVTTTQFGLNAGASRLITVTLRLPTGSDPNVAFGKVDTTTVRVFSVSAEVTGSAQLVTTVLPRPVIEVTPRQSLGSGKPLTPVPHAFTITNNGNVTVTLNLDYFTEDPANSPGVWATSVNTAPITLGPGANTRLGLTVTVPAGALQDVAATTYLTATVPASVSPAYPAQTVVFSATTRADLNPNADLFPDQEGEGGAGGVVPFTHNVENKSNGTAVFCLDYFAAAQSRVRFESATNLFVVDSRGCFTLYAGADINPSQGRFEFAQIRALVTIDERLTSEDLETVTIFLRKGSPTGESISDATVEDRIRVNAGFLLPRVWLPLIAR